VVERAVEVEKIKNSVTFFANAFAKLKHHRAIVEVFEEENIVQHVLRKVRRFSICVQGLFPLSDKVQGRTALAPH